jgi:hypothetical protein
MTEIEDALGTVILMAVRSFSFGSYCGCDEMDDLVTDPKLTIGPDLAAHIASYMTLHFNVEL